MTYQDAPPLRRVGGKWKLSDWIISFFPPHDVYVEPYAGGAAVFFRKEPSAIECINDLESDVVNFFKVLRERHDELARAIELTPFSREEYEQAYDLAAAHHDPVEWARRYYILAYQSFGAFSGRRTGWRYTLQSDSRSAPVGDWNRLTGLEKAARRLKQAHIEHDDALSVIKRWDSPKTLFYLDPPYLGSERTGGHRKRYALEMMGEHEHCQLAEVLHQIQGMAVLSGYDGPLYQRLYPDWPTFHKDVNTTGNSMATETLWVSPRTLSLGKLPLFAGM
ncbi:MAG: DNA adenine methylase [Anaerolineae bacterium]|nr:DNA adenine methylase [Anaerolineae bacterium]